MAKMTNIRRMRIYYAQNGMLRLTRRQVRRCRKNNSPLFVKGLH